MPSAEGNERMALERVGATVAPLGLAPARLRRLETAVAEATMNAMEHGNATAPTARSRSACSRRATTGSASRSPTSAVPGRRREAEVPDLEAKLAGLQRPRGWGLFLIKNMVDEARETGDGERHTLELVMRPPRTGADRGRRRR